MERSSHIAVKVHPDKMDSAAQHYVAVLGLEERGRTTNSIELAGPNFTVYVDATLSEPIVLQEFVAQDGKESKEAHRLAGCEIFDESEFGFHVRDPYGMHYHVWTSETSPD